MPTPWLKEAISKSKVALSFIIEVTRTRETLFFFSPGVINTFIGEWMPNIREHDSQRLRLRAYCASRPDFKLAEIALAELMRREAR
jgi:hypothetical protein